MPENRAGRRPKSRDSLPNTSKIDSRMSLMTPGNLRQTPGLDERLPQNLELLHQNLGRFSDYFSIIHQSVTQIWNALSIYPDKLEKIGNSFK